MLSQGGWTRKIRRSELNGQTKGWQPPREDITSPDLYIPSQSLVLPSLSAHADIPPGMALMTCVLAALRSRLQARFNASHLNPEILGVTASAVLAVVLMESAFIQLGCYFLSIQGQGQITHLQAAWNGQASVRGPG